MRVGYERDGSWRTFGLRKDFPTVKLRAETTYRVRRRAAARANLNPDYLDRRSSSSTTAVQLFSIPMTRSIAGTTNSTETEFAGPAASSRLPAAPVADARG
jgi:hypothetical protein